MSRFRSLNSYFKMLKSYYGECNFYVQDDITQFVGDDKFMIYDVVGDGLGDENILRVRGRYYLICERFTGCKFVEISKSDFERIYTLS